MLEKVKGLFRRDEEQAGGGRPSARLVDALKVLAVESPGLADRAVAYVHRGEGPEVLLELEALRGGDVEVLLGRPGQSGIYSWTTPAQDDRLKAAVPGWTSAKAVTARSNLYTLTDSVTIPELVRLGRVLSAVSSEVDRERPADPRWLTVLVNDMSRRANDRRKGKDGRAAPDRWTPDLLVALAVEGGVPEADATAVVLRELFERPTSSGWASRHLGPALLGEPARDFVVAHVDVATQALPGVSAAGRTELVELVASDPAATAALAPLLARLAADTSKGVREAAVAAVAQLPGERQREILTPLLTALPPSRLGSVVTRLAQVDGGLADLEEAAEQSAGARATLLRDTVERARVLDAAQEDEPTIEAPPFEPLPEKTLGDDFVRAARSALDTALERARTERAAHPGKSNDSDWPRWRREAVEQDLKELPGITDDDVRVFAAFLSGTSPRRAGSVAMRRLAVPGVFSRLPGTTLMHRLRLEADEGRRQNGRFGWYRLNEGDMLDVDLRALDEALRRIGRDDAEALIDELYFSTWWATDAVTPENAWPYYAGRLDRLAAALDDRERTYGTTKPARALAVLAQLPHVPRRFLPRLTELALGEGRTYRATAQEALSTHPGVRGLAEQGLCNGRSEVRRTAAEWLARLGDASAVPALRAALAKERSEVVRAAILTSLEALGEDISVDLAPQALLAEATKGLRAKAPVSMAWFGLDSLPAVRWAADGSPVDSTILRWWVMLAVKLKDPSGAGLLERYLSLLQETDRARVGSHVLSAWVAQDTRNPSPEESSAHAQGGAQRRYDMYQDWAKRSPQYYAVEASKTVEDHYRDLYREHQATYVGSAVKDKGMLALTVAMPGGELATTFQRYVKAHIGRRSQTEALVQALAANGQPAAIQELLAVSRRFRQATVQETAQRLAAELADRRGWTADQLADRTVQTAGFEDDGLLHLDLGSREYVGRITPAFTLELTSDAGKVVKALPAARAQDDPELVSAAKKQLTASRKELKGVVALQTQRLYEAMCVGRTWTAQEWQEYLLGHPVMSRLVERLVWVENPGTGEARPFRPDGGALVDADDEDVVLGEGSTVGLAHAVLLGPDATAAWAAHLADYEVDPLFAQLDVATPDVPAGATAIDDHKGWFSDSFSIRGRATKRGYTRSQAEDAGWFSAYTKSFASAGVVVQIEFTGSFVPEENIAAAVTALTFERTGRGSGRGTARIADLPPVLVAEAYRDYVAVAEAGSFDPDWERKSQY
ncbi:hypothetical protein CBR64_20720 [Cellulosimicrobium cellulans]|uniref:DUF4132 domain-containing protein n=1 Tax=Cellulosimicrobium cellulans TaxID=1710 RepID=A0A1Y0HZQ3_CELCE|nr:DUF4132 domain-containing protein [Cellulosimicrobium cellulans]ARU53490.1 hypothetical protein CBR64_20720 [Cellulosimicrobium cellulans]